MTRRAIEVRLAELRQRLLETEAALKETWSALDRLGTLCREQSAAINGLGGGIAELERLLALPPQPSPLSESE